MATATPPYVPVDGDVVVEEGMTEDNIIIQSLHWIGFRQQNQRQNIIDDSLGSFSDIRILSEKDTTAMATELAANHLSTAVSGTPRILAQGSERSWCRKFAWW